MQIINTWPNKADLNLPEAVSQAILNHLQQPFQTLDAAKSYWLESGTQLIISAVPDDSIPEYTDPLPDNYTISLVITSDSGEGVYYLTPPNQE